MPHIPPPLPWKQFTEPNPDAEYLVVLTYLPVNRLLRLPRFLAYVRKIQGQLNAAPAGLVGYSLLAKPHRSRYWTLSAWADAAALAAFMSESPHRDAMTGLHTALPGFQTNRWIVQGGELPPTWEDALARR
jgi:quinol monooxygenase YgiN